MRRLFAALAVAGTVSLSAMVPSASAQGIGFNPPGFGFGNPIGTGGLGGLGIGGIGGGLGCGFVAQNGIGANNTGQISAQAVPTGNNNVGGAGCGIGGVGGLGGLGFGLPGGLVNPPGFGFGNPIGVGGLGGLGVTGIGGFGGGLGCGFVAQNGIGANNTGQISAQAVPTGNNNVGGAGCNNGVLGALSGVNSGIGFGGLGSLVNPPGFGLGNPIGTGGLGGLGVTGIGGFGGIGGLGGVGGLGGLNCVPAGPVIVCQ